MKKIVVLHTDLRSYWKGRLYFLRSYFEKKNIDFEVLEIFGKGSPYAFDSVNQQETWWSCLFPDDDPNLLSKSTIQKKVFSDLDKIKPDLVIAGSVVFVSGALGLRWAKKNKKKVVIFDDATHSTLKRSRLVNFVKRTFTSQADGFLIPTPFYDKEYTKWGISKKRFFYGFDCVDNDFFKNNIPYQEKKKWIICIARLVPVKNLDRLLLAWKEVEKSRNNYSLILVGDGIERQRLENIVIENELHNVKFLGLKSSSQIAELLSESQAFILPSLSESWGLAVNEAMASGLPILVSNKVNAAHSIIHEGVSGYFFDPYSVDRIFQSINNFINLSIEEKESMGKMGFQRISLMNYSYMADQINRIVLELPLLPEVKTNFLVLTALNRWHGKYETKTWDFLT